MKHLPLFLLLGASPAAFAQVPTGASPAVLSLSGDWGGALGPLTLTAHLQDPPGGPRSGTLDVPAQNAKGLPLQLSTKADSVYLTLSVANARFAGRRAPNGQALVGEWQQGGRKLPLTFNRLSAEAAAAAAAGPARPQTPRGPFPYQAQEVAFTNQSAGIKLAGTLTTPAGKGPFPAVVLLTGSGPEDRDETLFGHKPFAVLADYLTRRGVAVLRFDDRGVDQSGGTLAGTTSADYAADARAALAWLRTQPGINPRRVGLVGHSEGGTAAILAAGQPLGPAMLVLLAAPGLPGDEMIVQQALALARVQKTDSIQLIYIEDAQRQVISIIEQTPDNAQVRAKLLPLLNMEGSTNPTRLAQVEAQIKQATSPGYRALLADRPAQTLAKVHCPVLALNGSKDVQVVAAPNLAAIRQGLQAAGNKDVTTKELPSLNHLFQTATTGSPAEYATNTETFAPAALQAIGDWLVAHGK